MKDKETINNVLRGLEDEDLILELGAGDTIRRKGWITPDNNESCHIVHDLRKPLPFPDNTFLRIYSSHVLEHFYYSELIRLLKEVYRILKRLRSVNGP